VHPFNGCETFGQGGSDDGGPQVFKTQQLKIQVLSLLYSRFLFSFPIWVVIWWGMENV
jgi:hypothetical protein